MKFTIAICTWNRALLLSRALDQLTRVQHPSTAWEVIVVNNNSTDNTERVLKRFVGRLPLRSVFEPRPGLSYSRNTAVNHATGDYVVWTDDDTLVDANWLVAYQRAIERWPEAAVFGGPVRPRFEGTPPQWLSNAWQDIRGAFASLDLGVEPFELNGRHKIPYGANFVVRMREQRQFAYDPALGRKQAAGALGEETAVIRAILASGGTGWWVPDAVVEHWIPHQRQTIGHLRRYYGLLGKTFYEWDARGVPTFWGRPRWLWRKTLRAELAYIRARSSGDPQRWLKPLVEASILWGAVWK
jgi:glycosyltransferase involved in cell wall biosynthesis